MESKAVEITVVGRRVASLTFMQGTGLDARHRPATDVRLFINCNHDLSLTYKSH